MTPHFRPAYHFTPAANWMNDPNGMVFHQGVYHLFFQYHPHSAVWGPMHWGHASSRDLMHWQEHDIALYPDALGMIFSGSAVIDTHNTSGLGRDGIAPWVALFTQHDEAAAQAGSQRFQTQSLAYSLDLGQSWTPYAQNPVLANPGLRDFRDPKVRWHPPTQRWLMCLAAADHVAFYSSPNLINWQFESDFGADLGCHDGIWECPDLFPLPLNGQTRWVLLVSLTSGGPNGGSATQYFVGDFDGHQFTPDGTATRWLDYGPDNYAGVTWSNTGERTVFIGWMSNWDYAKDLPTAPWRSAMTLPRELALRHVDGETFVCSAPAAEIQRAPAGPTQHAIAIGEHALELSTICANSGGQFALELSTDHISSFTLCLRNAAGDELRLGYDAREQAYFIDRQRAGLVDFNTKFAGRHTAPRFARTPQARLLLYVDTTSVELFADDGLSVLTSLYFAPAPFTHMRYEPQDPPR